jgi:hypothetical protein
MRTTNVRNTERQQEAQLALVEPALLLPGSYERDLKKGSQHNGKFRFAKPHARKRRRAEKFAPGCLL